MESKQITRGRGFFVALLSLILIFVITPGISAQEAKQVTLEKILKNPSVWTGIPVRIPLRFCMISNVYVPFRTLYRDDRYINLTAWSIREHIWEKKGFNSPHAYFYVEKDSRIYRQILGLKTFETICILGKTESTFAGKPFIRIVWFCKMPGNLNTANLKMLYQNMKAYKNRKFDQALEGFAKIIATNPPDDIKSMLHTTSAKIYMYDRKAYQQALTELNKAKNLTPSDPEVNELLIQCTYYLKHGGPEPTPENPNTTKKALEQVVPEENKKMNKKEKPVEDNTDKDIREDKVVDEPLDEPIDEPIDEPVDEPVDEPIEPKE